MKAIAYKNAYFIIKKIASHVSETQPTTFFFTSNLIFTSLKFLKNGEAVSIKLPSLQNDVTILVTCRCMDWWLFGPLYPVVY